MQSFKKKIKSILDHGIDPINEGIDNFKNPKAEVEDLAMERSEVCASCPMNVPEPIGILKVSDNRINVLSERMCDECGCTLAYKLRQSQTVCEKWEK